MASRLQLTRLSLSQGRSAIAAPCQSILRRSIAALQRHPRRSGSQSQSSHRSRARYLHTTCHPSASSQSSTTIYALSTPPGKSAVAVVRISGPACLDIYTSLTTRPFSEDIPTSILSSPPKPRYAIVRPIYHPDTKELLDPGALCLYFAGPKSHTGEDILELHLHGGPAIIRSVLAAIPLSCGKDIRYAEPGEFTRRAFYNSRLSLPEIEALGEALDATTEEQRKRAVRGNSAKLAERYESWRSSLIEARGELEALIDFAEDQHFEESNKDLVRSVAMQIEALRKRLILHADNSVRGELLKNGISLSLVGAPNAGKSSLLNRVVGREAVIVSDEAGTTRDVVDLAVDVGGFMVVLGDTAGLRVDDVGNKVGRIEEEGIRRAQARAMSGDVVVAVLDIETTDDGRTSLRISDQLEALINEAEDSGKEIVVVLNKVDLLPTGSSQLPMDLARQVSMAFPAVKEDRIFGISCVAGGGKDGIQEFLNGLTSIFKEMTSPLSSGSESSLELYESIGATERQRRLVEECIEHLDEFLEMAKVDTEGEITESLEDADEVDVVVMAEELRAAADCLGRITGRGERSGDVEEVLGVVFEKFCVGK